jgi:hypothetical protein
MNKGNDLTFFDRPSRMRPTGDNLKILIAGVRVRREISPARDERALTSSKRCRTEGLSMMISRYPHAFIQ